MLIDASSKLHGIAMYIYELASRDHGSLVGGAMLSMADCDTKTVAPKKSLPSVYESDGRNSHTYTKMPGFPG